MGAHSYHNVASNSTLVAAIRLGAAARAILKPVLMERIATK